MIELDRAGWERAHQALGSPPICCNPQFQDALADGYPGEFRARPWQVADTLVVGYQTGRTFPRLQLSPFGMAAAIADSSTESYARALGALAAKRTHRSVNVYLPFYASPLAPVDPWRVQTMHTHVLDLDADYRTLFQSAFKGATRTCIRRFHESDVSVEITKDADLIERYYRVHTDLSASRGYEHVHPYGFLRSLILKCSDVEFCVARHKDRVAAGGIFLHDGPTTFYWHGAADREFALMQPTYGILEYMIERSIHQGRKHFNFGASPNLPTVAKFKESWGARPRDVSVASTSHPLIRSVKGLVRRA